MTRTITRFPNQVGKTRSRKITIRKGSTKKVLMKTRASTGQIKKKGQYKSGMVGLREIRKYRQKTDLLIPRPTFRRVVHEIAYEVNSFSSYKFQASALETLQETTEEHLIQMFKAANLGANHAK